MTENYLWMAVTILAFWSLANLWITLEIHRLLRAIDEERETLRRLRRLRELGSDKQNLKWQ
jgi:hypothetical protein